MLSTVEQNISGTIPHKEPMNAYRYLHFKREHNNKQKHYL
jgi:hypothetical protein